MLHAIWFDRIAPDDSPEDVKAGAHKMLLNSGMLYQFVRDIDIRNLDGISGLLRTAGAAGAAEGLVFSRLLKEVEQELTVTDATAPRTPWSGWPLLDRAEGTEADGALTRSVPEKAQLPTEDPTDSADRPEPPSGEELRVARSEPDPLTRFKLLLSLARHAPEPERTEAVQLAFQAILGMPDPQDRRMHLLKLLMEPLPADLATAVTEVAIKEALASGDHKISADLLIQLMGLVSEARRHELSNFALAEANAIPDPFDRAGTLGALSAKLPLPTRQSVFTAALQLTRSLGEPERKASLFRILLPKAPAEATPDLETEYLDAIVAIPNPEDRVKILSSSLRRLSEEGRKEGSRRLLRFIEKIKHVEARCASFRKAISIVPTDLAPSAISGALAAAALIPDHTRRSSAFTGIVNRSPAELRALAVRDAVLRASSISDNNAVASLITRIAKRAPESVQEEAYAAALSSIRQSFEGLSYSGWPEFPDCDGSAR
jgi:hypothetical protein